MISPKWILLAEDNAHDADLAARALAADQATGDLVIARDGAEVLDCLFRRGNFYQGKAGNPAVIVLDLKMPKMDGLEVLRRIKSDPALKRIPVVVFTSSPELSDLARCYELGANAYVVKPVAFHQFAATLREIRAFWLMTNEPPPGAPMRPLAATHSWQHVA